MLVDARTMATRNQAKSRLKVSARPCTSGGASSVIVTNGPSKKKTHGAFHIGCGFNPASQTNVRRSSAEIL